MHPADHRDHGDDTTSSLVVGLASLVPAAELLRMDRWRR